MRVIDLAIETRVGYLVKLVGWGTVVAWRYNRIFLSAAGAPV